MTPTLSPREIQTRIRAGASVADVAAEAELPEERISVFASPVIAEREHMARSAQGATVRRKGSASTHRKLSEVLRERLGSRGIDPDDLKWDSWREPDLRWRVVAELHYEGAPRRAEFLFDPKGRFSIADNTDARWMIGEQIGSGDPDEENTVDFDDELALVRATQDVPSVTQSAPDNPHDDVPEAGFHDAPQTSELDELYDLLSGVSEDSVRIYVGLDEETDPVAAMPADEPTQEPDEPTQEPDEPTQEPDEPRDHHGDAVTDLTEPEPSPTPEPEATHHTGERPRGHEVTEPQQDSLLDDDNNPQVPKKRRKRGRAQVPSWDEIMFGR